jgi:hypothetical protein
MHQTRNFANIFLKCQKASANFPYLALGNVTDSVTEDPQPPGTNFADYKKYPRIFITLGLT